MTNELDRSRLDAIIDDVVRDMMQVDAGRDLAGRVLRSIDGPPRRPWFLTGPTLAAAALAVIVLTGAMMAGLFTTADPVVVPSIQVAVGPSPALETAPAAPQAADLPRPSRPPASAPSVASAESIFGPQRGQVGAASLRSLPQVRLALVLSEAARTGQPRTQTLMMVLSHGEKRQGLAGADGEPQLRVDATPEVLPSGSIKLIVAVLAPLQQQLTVTLVPGASTQLLDAIDQTSGRRITIDATATLVKPERPQR